ncbi:hypothetical protein TRVL_03843 [Trypanosoma vivax]|nr:hypothetical protein TRVL_03843 [Trypanosoma vivax]
MCEICRYFGYFSRSLPVAAHRAARPHDASLHLFMVSFTVPGMFNACVSDVILVSAFSSSNVELAVFLAVILTRPPSHTVFCGSFAFTVATNTRPSSPASVLIAFPRRRNSAAVAALVTALTMVLPYCAACVAVKSLVRNCTAP